MQTSRYLLTSIYDVDEHILLQLDIDSLYHICLTNKNAQSICNNSSFWKTKFKYDHLPLSEPLPITLKQWVHKYINTINNILPLPLEQYDFRTYPKTLINFDETFKNMGIIGRGTFAETYLVIDNHNNSYALKLFYSKNLKEYEDEVKTLIDLSTPTCHPDIICYKDHFILNNQYAILTDYIEGKTLEQFIRSNHLTLKEVKFIILQLLSILIWLHQKGYRHGDILTGNIIVTKDMKIKLIDFGLAVRIDDLTDARGDIFNVGRILYILLSNVTEPIKPCFDYILEQFIGSSLDKYWDERNVHISAKQGYYLLLNC